MPIKAHQLGPGTLTIGSPPAKDFAIAASSTKLTPSVETDDDIHVLSGDTEPGADRFKWELSITLYQDFDKLGLADYLFDNRGQVVPFEWVPNTANTRGWTGKVKLRPMELGGDIRKRNTSDLTLPLVGDPVKKDHSPG